MKDLTYKCFTLFWIAQLLTGIDSLKCYSCINLQCPDTHPFCDRAKLFVLQELSNIYSSYGSQVPFCPSPEDAIGWESLAARPDLGNCQGKATCALGRLKITTTFIETKQNVTFYGTSLGCSSTSKVPNLWNTCGITIGHNSSWGFQFLLEIEHCVRKGEICKQDFCTSPSKTVVKLWRQDNIEDSSKSHIRIVFWTILLIGGSLFLLLFLGIRYHSIIRFFVSS